MELTVIAAVVIGGTALTGGEGYVLGALFGVLITALIQSLIQFNGQLSSWWTSIFIGVLMLLFIGVQSLLATLNSRRLARAALRRRAGERALTVAGSRGADRGRRVWWSRSVIGGRQARPPAERPCPSSSGGNGKPLAAVRAASRSARTRPRSLVEGGAVIVYERNGGAGCVDELFAIYPDGRIVGDDGTQQVEAQLSRRRPSPASSTSLEALGWFTDDMYSTSHTPCGQCFTYFTSVTSRGPDEGRRGRRRRHRCAQPSTGSRRAGCRPVLPKFGAARDAATTPQPVVRCCSALG